MCWQAFVLGVGLVLGCWIGVWMIALCDDDPWEGR